MPFLLSQLIEALRWMGALAVVGLHATNLFVNQADIMSAPHAAPAYVWWFLTGFESGHQAVVGFFVISGYLVGGAVLTRLFGPDKFLRDYFINRLSRVYIVLIPTLIVTFALDFLGRHFFTSSAFYDGTMFTGHFSTGLFFTSLLNLQGIYYAYFGTNGPLWSLACESWYYITFPLLLLPFAKAYTLKSRIFGFISGVLIFIFLIYPQSWFGFGFVLWAVGAFATRLARPLLHSRAISLALLALILIVIRLGVRGAQLETYPWISHVADLLAAIAFANCLTAFRDADQNGYCILRTSLHRFLADFSFSLYAIHMPILVFLRAGSDHILSQAWVMQLAQVKNYLLASSVILIAILCAYCFSRVTEAKTAQLRQILRRWCDRMAPMGSILKI